MQKLRTVELGLALLAAPLACGRDQRSLPLQPGEAPAEVPSSVGGSPTGGSVVMGDGGSNAINRPLGGEAGASQGGQGGEAMEGSNDDPVGVAEPSWEKLYGHFDLWLYRDASEIPPEEQAECVTEYAHHFSLREGENGPEARFFKAYGWNGWPDQVELDNGRLLVSVGERRGSEYWGSPALSFPVDEGGFVFRGNAVFGAGTLRFHCPSGIYDEKVNAYLFKDSSNPVMRASSSTGEHIYPFSYFTFAFSEPIGFTTDSYPWGSFTTTEQGELVQYLVPEGAPPDVEIVNWPFGPVVVARFVDPLEASGAPGYFWPRAGEFDDAGNPLVGLYPERDDAVLDLGPIQARLDFDLAPPMPQKVPAQYVPPGNEDSLCEGESGCVVIENGPDSCQSGEMQEFAVWVGDGPTRGARIRYRFLSSDISIRSELEILTSTTGLGFTWPPLSSDAGPIGGLDYSTPWSTQEMQKVVEEFPDFMGIVFRFRCPEYLPPGPEVPSEKLILEWVEAMPPE